MSSHIIKNLVLTLSAASGALLMWVFSYQDGLFSTFNIHIEYYLDSLSELTLRSLFPINVFLLLGILPLFGGYYWIYLNGLLTHKKRNDSDSDASDNTEAENQTVAKPESSKPLKKLLWWIVWVWVMVSLLGLIGSSVAETLQWLSGLCTASLQLLFTVSLTLTFAFFSVKYKDSILKEHRWATILKTWFPIVMLLLLFMFVGGMARLFGQWKAAQIRESKIQVVLMYDNKPIVMEEGTYYISHTKRWIFFYNENQPNGHISYPLGTVSSVRFKYK